MGRKLISLSCFLILINSAIGYSQTTAKIDVKIENFGFLQLQAFTFFYSENQFDVKKNGDGNYTVNYFGKQPKLLFLNTHAIYVSPGDSVQLTYKTLNADPYNYLDTIMASGTNVGNYVFSNFNYRKPREFYGNAADTERYENDHTLLYSELKKKYESYDKEVNEKLVAAGTNPNLTAYFQRQSKLLFIFDMLGYEEKYTPIHPAKAAYFQNIADSLFQATNFIPADTVYTYTMEQLFKKYIGRAIKSKFNSLKTKTDFDQLMAYLRSYPSDFVKQYFVYFLATDYNYLISKYPSDEFKKWVALTHDLKRVRFDFMTHSGVVR